MILKKNNMQLKGCKIYAQLTGYAATSDGLDMVSPSGEGKRDVCKLPGK